MTKKEIKLHSKAFGNSKKAIKEDIEWGFTVAIS